MDKSSALFRASSVIILDYPLDAALTSALSICDEAVVVVDTNSRDHTVELVYTLQKAFGPERVIVVEQEWEFDRAWQEKCWNWAAAATDAEWLMFHDADEAIHEDSVPAIKATMARTDINLIRLPFIHLYATPRFRANFSLHHNTRLGRRSAGYRMRNWCSDHHPKRAACQMVFGGDERNAHIPNRKGLVTLEGCPVMHYGWCRSAQALAISQRKQSSWYKDGAGIEDGRIPTLPPHDFRLTSQIKSGFVTRCDGPHPSSMTDWFALHAEEWKVLDA